MKTKLAAAFVLVLLTIAFIFNHASENSSTQLNNAQNTAGMNPPLHPEGFYDTYYIGCMNLGNVTEAYSNQYEDLGFNLWHAYPRWCGSNFDNGWINWVPADVLNTPDNSYTAEILNGPVDFAHQQNMRILMDRIKINYMAYGQRSDYQCEASNTDEDLWFYTYKNHYSGIDDYDDDPNYGSNSWVRYCSYASTNGGQGSGSWVVTGLNANREQINPVGFSHKYMQDNVHKWYVKPRIRADKNYVENHYDEALCRVDVLNFNGDLIKSVVVRARNFQDTSGAYNGKYKDEFRFIGNDSDFTFEENEAVNFNPDGKEAFDTQCQVDFKVYWYGNCDMWIDYVRVENEPARRLFSGEFENTWLAWEVNDIAMADPNNTILKFYIEEFEFNMLPSMAYVARKIREKSGGKYNLMCDLNYGEFVMHAPLFWENFGKFDAAFIKRFVIDSLQSNEIFTFSYPFNAYLEITDFSDHPVHRPDLWTTPSYVPSTLPISGYDKAEGRFSFPRSPAEYDTWLQEWFDSKQACRMQWCLI